MKKFFAILMAAMMLLAMTTAFAGSGFTITVPASTTGVSHTYEVYQIFTGTLSEDGTILSEVKWGQNGTGTEGEAVADEILEELAATTGTDKQKLAVIETYVKLENAYTTVADGEEIHVPAGYYLIKDVDGSLDDMHDAYTTYIVYVCNDLTVAPKSVYPTVDKEVQDEVADAEAGATDGWGESADHAINETFSFRLTADLPLSTKYADYETYKVTFNDSMSDGITFEEIVSVTVDGVAVTDYACTATAGQAGGTWTLTIEDLKTIDGVDLTDGAKIVVVYNAHLNEAAQVDTESVESTENENSVYLTYSNNPNVGGEGKTPTDYVWVFTYTVENTKYDGDSENGKTLEGAGFTLYAGDVAVKLIDNGDGTYTVADQDAEDGYVTEMMTKADGLFNIIGLDAGSYTLKETTVPDGYNKCEDVAIIIKAEHAENEKEDEATMTLDSASTMNNAVENKSGATLPETGGIGTTLFYLLGGLMTAGSALVLVVRRRAEAEEE